MSKLELKIDNEPLNGISDIDGIFLEATLDGSGQKVSSTEFTFFGEAAKRLLEWMDGGLDLSKPGVFEGVNMDLNLDCDGEIHDVIKATIDLTTAQRSLDMVKASIIQRGGLDFITQIADSFNVTHLTTLKPGEKGRITQADYVDLYYQIGKYPQALEILMALFAVYTVAREIADIVEKITDAAAATTGGISGALETALQIAALIIYLIAELIALLALLIKVFELIFPFVYYHRAMLWETIWKKCAEYVGYTFKSSIYLDPLVKQLGEMPAKDTIGKKVGLKSNESGCYEGTFGDFIQEQERFFNAELRVNPITKELIFENKELFQAQSDLEISPLCIEFTSTNAAEINANYYMRYASDSSDLWSLSVTKGKTFQSKLGPKLIVDKRNILLKGLQRVDFPQSLINVKTSESELEVVIRGLYDAAATVVNFIVNLAGGGNALPIIPKYAVDIAQFDSHFTGRKIFLYKGKGYIRRDFAEHFGTNKLWEKYHFTNSPVPQKGNLRGNQWVRRSWW